MQFDATITFGNVMTMIAILVATGYMWSGMKHNVKAIETWIAEHKEESKKREEQQTEIRLSYVKLQSLVESHEKWIREIATPNLRVLSDALQRGRSNPGPSS